MYLLFFVISLLCQPSSGSYSGTLRSVQIIFRHGERVPTNMAPFKNENSTSLQLQPIDKEPGELTNRGLQQVYQFGRHLRATYGRFIGDIYKPSKLRVLAGEENRTIACALGVLAGLFPPYGAQIWGYGRSRFRWQPIPVHTDVALDTTAFDVFDNCPALSESVRKSSGYDTLMKEDHEQKKWLSEMSGWNTSDVRIYNRLADVIISRAKINSSLLPKWAENETFVHQMEDLSYYLNTKFIDLFLPEAGGFLMNLILADIEERINGTNKHHLALYSAHDSSILTIGRYLKLQEINRLGDYLSNLAFEHHFISGEDVIQVWYQQNPTASKIQLEIPGCGSPCTFVSLRSQIPRFSRSQYMYLCKGQELFCSGDSRL